MASLNDIKRRIKSVKNTQQITKAMKMVAASKLRKAQEDIIASRPYADKMFAMVGKTASGTNKDANPLLSQRSESGNVDIILFTSDRGLCGGFNTNLVRLAEKFIKDHPEKNVRVRLVGTRGNEHFKRREFEILSFNFMGSTRPQMDTAAAQTKVIIEDYLSGSTDEVHVIYGKFISTLTQEPTLKKLFPFDTDDTENTEETSAGEPSESSVPSAGFTYEPSEDEVLETLLPKAAQIMIFNAMLETAASEHAARMASMDSASKNAKEMIESLNIIYNRVRQTAITTELIEIVSGAEALKG